jgi:hypothetical protein
MNDLAKSTNQLPANRELFIKYHTPKQCMVLYEKITTPLLAVKSKSTSLISLRKAYSSDMVQAYIELWIVDLNEFLNVSRPMNEPQIRQTAWFILSKYPYLLLADLTLVFNRAKLGEYGQFYESIDGPKILSWFEKYDKERWNACEEETILESDKYKEPDGVRSSHTLKFNEHLKKIQTIKIQREYKKH